jgi:hypothetical protein
MPRILLRLAVVAEEPEGRQLLAQARQQLERAPAAQAADKIEIEIIFKIILR